jgi:hypothetical protein
MEVAQRREDVACELRSRALAPLPDSYVASFVVGQKVEDVIATHLKHLASPARPEPFTDEVEGQAVAPGIVEVDEADEASVGRIRCRGLSEIRKDPLGRVPSKEAPVQSLPDAMPRLTRGLSKKPAVEACCAQLGDCHTRAKRTERGMRFSDERAL